MDVVPSTVHGILKFEYQGDLHIVIGDPKLYALCNAIYMEEYTMTSPRYKIIPLEVGTIVIKLEK